MGRVGGGASESLTELCDLLVSNTALAKEKLPWIRNQSRSRSCDSAAAQCQVLVAISRFLSRSKPHPDLDQERSELARVVVDFIHSLPDLPAKLIPFSSSPLEGGGSYFGELGTYLVQIAESGAPEAPEICGAIADMIHKAVSADEPVDLSTVMKDFLSSLARHSPKLDPPEDVAANLLEKWILPSLSLLSSSEPHKNLHKSLSNRSGSPPPRRNSLDQSFSYRESTSLSSTPSTTPGATPSHKAVGKEHAQIKPDLNLSFAQTDLQQYISHLQEESVGSLEKLEIAFRLLAGMLETKRPFANDLRTAATKQLKLLPFFLRLRKRDWPVDINTMRVKILLKLGVGQAAALALVKCFLVSDVEGKALKSLLRETLTVMLDAADACVVSPWRKHKACEELFGLLLSGVAQITTIRGSLVLRVLLIRFRTLILGTCAQYLAIFVVIRKADAWGNNRGLLIENVVKASCQIIMVAWSWDLGAVKSFLLALATNIREPSEHEEKEKQAATKMQLNVIGLLADLALMLKKSEVVDMVLPVFLESLEEGDASTPSLLRLRLLEAVARMASMGYEKSYRETVVLLTRSYLESLSTVGSTQSRTLAAEATTERVETLPGVFLTIAQDLKQADLRSDYRQRLLQLCSDVGLAAESKSGRSGADLLGPLLPSVAEICSDVDPCQPVEPSLLKLFRNLWFYIALFGLAPPIQKGQGPSKSVSSSAMSSGSMSAIALQAVAGPYMWNTQWSEAVRQITEGTPPLVVSTVKWLEDELELNELHNPGSRRGSSSEKAAFVQKTALSAALGGRVETTSMNTISGVKATYFLAVAFLEILRLSCHGGLLRSILGEGRNISALNCVFKYLETPNLTPALYLCLKATVQRAFDAAITWLDERSNTGIDADERDTALTAHACFLISNMLHREENVRELSGNLLTQLKDKYPQVLWNKSCLSSLFQLLEKYTTPPVAADSTWFSSVKTLLQKHIREWVVQSLSLAPCTTLGLLQEQLNKLNTWPKPSNTADMFSILSDIHINPMKSGNIPAMIAAAAAAAGLSLGSSKLSSLELLSTTMFGANVKSQKVNISIGGLTLGPGNLTNNTTAGRWVSAEPPHGKEIIASDSTVLSEIQVWKKMLISKFLQQLQQFVATSEKGWMVNSKAFHETCLDATALLLSDQNVFEGPESENAFQLVRLLCWCPAYICTSEAMETGIFVWTWILSAAPQLGSLLLSEILDAWMWTVNMGRGLFASGTSNSGPAAKLRPHLFPGGPVQTTDSDPVGSIAAHRIWLGFFLDRFEVVKHSNVEQLLLIGRLLQESLWNPKHFSCHPAATGAFFTLLILGLKFCSHQSKVSSQSSSMSAGLLKDRIYRAGLSWFSVEPGWYESNLEGFAQSEAQVVALFAQFLSSERLDTGSTGQAVPKSGAAPEEISSDNGSVCKLYHSHPVWGRKDNSLIGKEKRKQLFLMLCQHEAERLDTWAAPLKEASSVRPRINSERWVDYAKTAWSVDPGICLALISRFPAASSLRVQVTALVQEHLPSLYEFPEALPHFVTPKAVEENSAVLQLLPHWAPCSITRALEFLTPAYKGHQRVMAYVLRVLESYPPEKVTFFMPQLVQALRYDIGGLVENYVMNAAQRSNLFAHILIWQLQGEEPSEEARKESVKDSSFQETVLKVKERIIQGFTSEAYDMFEREFQFFDEVTSISGKLFDVPKEKRREGIQRELEKIDVLGDDLYLPTDPNKLVRSIRVDSGIPLQSAAKVPIMVTFNVVESDGDPTDIKPQACIFKVGDDCRQDVLALQVIALLRDIFKAVGLNLYLFPYGVLPTGPEKGIIEVVPKTRSRNQMGETTDGGLYEIFQQDYGPVGSPSFEAARDNFIVSSAGYAVASLLLQPKDRHNGNLLFDNEGRLVHIDFGFILETSPGGNMRFESAHFKLSHEMTQLLDPSGVMKSETWHRFVSLCVKGYLAARLHMDGIVNTVLLMVDSGLPCFSRGDPIGNLRKRFHPEMSEREAAGFMIKTCVDAYNKWTTAGYDLIQYLQQGIEK